MKVFIIGGAGSGQEAYAKEMYPQARVIADYHRIVRQQLADGREPMEEAEKLLQAEADSETLVITSDEIGGGVVPMEAADRAWREASGRVNCRFAKEADLVIRMICGIPQVIKAETNGI